MPSIATRRRLLEQTRRELRDRLARIRRDRTRVDEPLDPDFAEQAVQRENDEVLDQLESGSLSELGRIEHALAHLEKGRGNHCECCGKTISRDRLKAVIHATQCAHCSETPTADTADAGTRSGT